VRIALCDYSGHPFQVQLSRELARRGHFILHLHFAGFQTPKGRLETTSADPATLKVVGISLDRPFAKHTFVRRRVQEIEVGERICRQIDAFAPDAVIACNLPLDTLTRVVRLCRKADYAFIYWQQDIYSLAITRILTQRFGVVGRFIGAYYRHLERRALSASAAIVVIADEFVTAVTRDFGISRDKVHVIENWAPLDEIAPGKKANDWTCSLGLDKCEVVLYTGTIGMKHDPAHIVALAQALRCRSGMKVVVASEGPGANWIASEAGRLQLENVAVVGFQPYNVYSDFLAGADVTVAILEQHAGEFAVPSKILSYLSAGRPVVLCAPEDNLASRIVIRSGGGIAVPAGDSAGLARAVKFMLDDGEARRRAGENARNYAEANFNIHLIGDRFEGILVAAVKGLPAPSDMAGS
jgi:colanic acid biosynthesis glycosyl transferase WcaI